MSKVNDDILMAGAIGVGLLSLLLGPPLIKPRPKTFVHGTDGIGMTYYIQHIQGFLSSFYLGHIRDPTQDTAVSFTDGIYDQDYHKIPVSAQIILLITSGEIDLTEDAGHRISKARGEEIRHYSHIK